MRVSDARLRTSCVASRFGCRACPSARLSDDCVAALRPRARQPQTASNLCSVAPPRRRPPDRTERAGRRTGLPLSPVTDDGAPSGRRKFRLWNPPLVDELLNLRSSNTMEAADILAELMRNGVRTICLT